MSLREMGQQFGEAWRRAGERYDAQLKTAPETSPPTGNNPQTRRYNRRQAIALIGSYGTAKLMQAGGCPSFAEDPKGYKEEMGDYITEKERRENDDDPENDILTWQDFCETPEPDSDSVAQPTPPQAPTAVPQKRPPGESQMTVAPTSPPPPPSKAEDSIEMRDVGEAFLGGIFGLLAGACYFAVIYYLASRDTQGKSPKRITRVPRPPLVYYEGKELEKGGPPEHVKNRPEDPEVRQAMTGLASNPAWQQHLKLQRQRAARGMNAPAWMDDLFVDED